MGEPAKIGEFDVEIKDDKKTVVELTVEKNQDGEWVILEQELLFEDILLGGPGDRTPSQWETNKILEEKLPEIWNKYFAGDSTNSVMLRMSGVTYIPHPGVIYIPHSFQ